MPSDRAYADAGEPQRLPIENRADEKLGQNAEKSARDERERLADQRSPGLAVEHEKRNDDECCVLNSHHRREPQCDSHGEHGLARNFPA